MFNRLRETYLKENEAQKNNTLFYIKNGFCESWNETEKKFSDQGIKRYSTEKRWSEYQTGTITREKAVELAQKRTAKQFEKRKAETLEKITAIEEAPEIKFISVNVEFKRSQKWGYNPTAEVRTNTKFTVASTSGCGYDKESAAVASAFNQNYSILKILYELKEKDDNIGYGLGYGALPYFEGGVGVGCFWSALKKAGYKVSCNYGKHEK